MLDLIKKNTPVELYRAGGREIFVKREDKCIDQVKFSKLRGVAEHLKKIDNPIVGVMDSLHSKAGWGVSYICSKIGKKAVVFFPVYKGEKFLRENQWHCKQLGSELWPMPADRSFILFNRAKKILKEKHPDAYMIPNALKLDETVIETAREVETVPWNLFEDCTWIVSVSSGTIAAGVLLGLIRKKAKVVLALHLGYSRDPDKVIKYLNTKIGTKEDRSMVQMYIIDEKYEYKDQVNFPCPFPCNKYYDLKAWKWLVSNTKNIKTKQILFWNIGE